MDLPPSPSTAHILKQAFGASSSSDDDEGCHHQVNLGGLYHHHHHSATVDDDPAAPRPSHSPHWERIDEIDGLWLCRDFLSDHRQLSLLSAIESEGWFIEASHNQAMRFGSLPAWATELSNSIREAAICGDVIPEFESAYIDALEEAFLSPVLPFDLLQREPLFDQLIVNLYHPGQGICPHVDLLRFEDGIAIISLESPCIMHFTPVKDNSCTSSGEDKEGQPTSKVPVYLAPGSLILMSGEARYLWKHEINRKPGFQVWQGQEIDQRRRISITLRKLCLAE